MSNKFEIQISASDGFSKQFDKLNEAAAASNAKALAGNKALGKEVASTFRTGSRYATEFASSLTGSSSALATLAGLGSAGSIGAVATGLVSLETSWAGAGFEVNRTSSLIGVSTEVLQKWRGISKLAGGSTEDMTQALAGLAKTMQDAEFRRNDTARGIFSLNGIELKRTADGYWDVESALLGVGQAMQKLDPQARLKLAEILGIPSDVIPTLMKGADALQELGKQAEKLGLVQGKAALDWAQQMTDSFNRLGQAAEGVKNKVGQTIAPGAVGAMNEATKILEKPLASNPLEWPINALINAWNIGDAAGAPGADPKDAVDFLGRRTRPRINGMGPPTAPMTPNGAVVPTTQSEIDKAMDDVHAWAESKRPAGQRVEIKVSVPDGARVTATSNGAPVKIGHAMSGY